MDTTNTVIAPEVKHLECVAEAAVDIFNITCGLTLEPTGGNEHLSADGVIIAIISLVGDVEWSVFLGLPRQTATSVAAKFAGFEIPFDSKDMGDAVGELSNILGGQVKMLLDRRGVKADISLPSVMRVESMKILIRHDTVGTKTCFDSTLGKLWTSASTGKHASIIA